MVKAKKRKADNPTIEPVIDIKLKKRKSGKKSNCQKPLNPEVVEFYKKVNVPLDLVTRHGAGFKAQSKRAIRTIYKDGKEY